MLMTDYDVIIIGAGPAGATCAMLTQKKGLKTLVIEKNLYPCIKVCAGMVIGEGEKLIDELYPNMPSLVYASKKLEGPKVYYGNKLLINSKGMHRNYNRERLDYWMIENANTEVIFGANYLRYENKDNRIKIFYFNQGKECSCTCKYLVGAHGGDTILSGQVFPEVIEKINYVTITQYTFNSTCSLSRDNFYIFMEKGSFVNYLVPKDDFWIAAVGFKIDQDGEKVNENFLTLLRDEFDLSGKIIEKKVRIATDLWATPIFGKDNILLIGEAAGLWGRAGDGIWFGIESGMVCAQSIIKAEEGRGNVLDLYLEGINQSSLKNKTLKGHGNAIALGNYHRDVDREKIIREK